MKHLYQSAVVAEIRKRIDALRPDAKPQWGRMTAPQVLAHCATVMDYALGELELPRSTIGRVIGPRIKRSLLLEGKPLARNAKTHPRVVVTDDRDFEAERLRLHAAIARFATGGSDVCTRHPHFFFGPMTPLEWAEFSYIHLDHHLRQFGV
jgi:hypothetical protein